MDISIKEIPEKNCYARGVVDVLGAGNSDSKRLVRTTVGGNPAPLPNQTTCLSGGNWGQQKPHTVNLISNAQRNRWIPWRQSSASAATKLPMASAILLHPAILLHCKPSLASFLKQRCYRGYSQGKKGLRWHIKTVTAPQTNPMGELLYMTVLLQHDYNPGLRELPSLLGFLLLSSFLTQHYLF